MRLSPEIRTLIDRAVAAGRVRRIAMGVRSLIDPAPPPAPAPRIAAEQCLGGRQVWRHPRLDQLDRGAR